MSCGVLVCASQKYCSPLLVHALVLWLYHGPYGMPLNPLRPLPIPAEPTYDADAGAGDLDLVDADGHPVPRAGQARRLHRRAAGALRGWILLWVTAPVAVGATLWYWSLEERGP